MRTSWALLAALVLAGCSRHEEAPRPPVAASGVAAIARGRVDVEGGVVNLPMPREGIVARVAVRPGDHVRRGDLLAELDLRQATTEVKVAQAERAHAEAELKALEIRAPLLKVTAQRWRDAAAAGAAEQQRADEAQQELSRLAADIEVARAGVALADHRLELARAEVELRRLRSPADAEVVQVLVQPGSGIAGAERAAAFVLLPSLPRIVRADLNESFIRRVHPGMAAQVSVEADASLPPLKARVLRISPVLAPARMTEEQQITRSLECVLQFDEDAGKTATELRIGQNVLVNFHEEKQQ